MSGHIVTSDYMLIEKTIIHRLISSDYPEIREIPRIFIFDCCDGTGNQELTKTAYGMRSISEFVSSASIDNLDEMMVEMKEMEPADNEAAKGVVTVENMEKGRGW